MKLRSAIIPLVAVAAVGTYIAFHPGVAYAEPKIAQVGKPTQITGTGTYTIDPMHTSIYFEVSHMGLANVHGRFNKFSGKITQAGSDLSKASVEFTAKVDSIDTNVAPRDTHLKSADFFEVAKYPDLTFKSTKVSKSEDGYIADGVLSIKGNSKPVSLPFKYYGPLPGSGDQPTRIGVIVEPIKINRRDFGITYGSNLPNGDPMIGDQVTIRLNVEATQDK
jgi:polyisoprenoid-binding protein YceI